MKRGPGAEPRGQSLGERRGGAPEGERSPTGSRPLPAKAATPGMERGHLELVRRSALRLPFSRRMILSENRTPLFGIMRFVRRPFPYRAAKLGREQKTRRENGISLGAATPARRAAMRSGLYPGRLTREEWLERSVQERCLLAARAVRSAGIMAQLQPQALPPCACLPRRRALPIAALSGGLQQSEFRPAGLRVQLPPS
jgi:hypothetical protein